MSEPKDPEPWFWFGLVVFGAAWATTAFVAPWYEPLKFLAPQSSTLGGLAILFFGAILSLRIYDSVNRKAEKRQLRQEYALSRVKDIYAPLWDETVALIERAEKYDIADLSMYGRPEEEELAKHGFDHIMASSLGRFVDSEVASRLFTFRVAVARYNKAYGTARDDAYDRSRVAAAELTGREADQGPAGAIANLFMTNIRFIWGATHFGEDAQRAMRDRFGEMFAQVRSAGPKETAAAFEALRGRLWSLDSAKAMRRESEACAGAGKVVIARLEEIVRDPTSVVFEFSS